jgi:hypothetical protein
VFHTVLDVACRNAVGQTLESDIVAAIWSDFEAPIPGVRSWDGIEMKYWPDGYATPKNHFTFQLVAAKKGRCGAWRQLFADTLRVHGIQSTLLVIKPDVADIADKVPPPAGFPYLARISFVINQDHPGQGNSGPPLLAGQPGPGLPIEFPNHFVSLYEAGSLSSIFDPSYGLWFSSTTALANAQNAWAQASVAGFLPMMPERGV